MRDGCHYDKIYYYLDECMSAIDYALRGITTVEEVQRVAYDDEED